MLESAMHNWTRDITAEDGPKYAAIAAALTRAIRDGRLRSGQRLPAQRELAQVLGVDLTTVTRAYGIVRDDGLIEGSGRLGSYVRNDAPLGPRETDDVGMNMPPQPASALLDEALRTGTAQLLRAGGATPLLQYQPSGGNSHDRNAAAIAMAAYGLAATEDEVIVTAGGQNALHAIIGAGLRPDPVIATGPYTYPGLLSLAGRFGLRLFPVDSDEEGLDPDALGRAAEAGVNTLYVVPTNDNPTTSTMSIDRRKAIVEVVRRHGLVIVEDDAYGRLPSKPLPPIAAFAPERTWHIASLSKIISPALRVAHVRAPSAHDAWLLAADVQETAIMAPPLNAALLSLWLRDGRFDELVSAVRTEAVARQRLVAHLLAGLDHAVHAEGFHIWLRSHPALGAAELTSALRPTGLSAVPGERFLVDKSRASPFVRISIGGAIGHERLVRGFETLGAIAHRGTHRVAKADSVGSR
jgi:DNA-binding transcriptional MocR family regulator